MGKSRRAIVAEAEEALEPPQTLTDSQSVVRVIKPEGNNVYTCQLPNNSRVQLELAQHFRNTVYMRRGGFVLAERYPADSEEKRVDGEIVNIVRDEKLWRKLPYWPKEFVKQSAYSDSDDESNVGKMPPSDSGDEEPQDRF